MPEDNKDSANSISNQNEGTEREKVDKAWAELRVGPIIVGILTFGPIIIATSRVLIAADGDQLTLLVLLATLDVVPLVVTSLLSVSALLPATIVLFLIGLKAQTSTQTYLFGVISAGLIVALGVFGLPWWATLILGLVLLLVVTWGSELRAFVLENPIATGATIPMSVIAMIVAASGTFWLPSQAITVNDTPSRIVYVLREQGHGLVVFYPDSHVEFIQISNIKKLEFCYNPQVEHFLLYGRTPSLGTGVNKLPPPCP